MPAHSKREVAAEDGWALRSYAHLVAAWTVAVLNPMLVLPAENVQLLAIRKPSMAELVVVVFALTLVPPSLLLATERIAGIISPRVRRGMHLLFVGGLMGLTTLYALKTVTSNRGVLLLASALVAIVATYLYRRFRAVRWFATAMLVIVPLTLGAFFLDSDVRAALEDPPVGPQATHPGEIPVVLLILDELPVSSLMNTDGGINGRRFPNFAELAREAIWFRNATTVSPGTVHAVPAIFTGLRPKASAQPVRSDHPRNVFTVLAKSHSVTAVEPHTHLCPAEVCPRRRGALRSMVSLSSALSVGYTHTAALDRLGLPLPSLGSTWGEAIGRKRPHREPSPSEAEPADLDSYGGLAFDDFLRRIRPYRAGSRPPLYVLHSSLPHVPWKYLPSGKRYTTLFEFPPGGGPWSNDRTLTQLALQRHLLQARSVDTLVGRLIERLKESALYSRSLLMVVADHGASFRVGSGPRPITHAGAADTAFVPLFVKPPGHTRGEIVNRHVETIDVLPTVADILDARLPSRVDGKSLLGKTSSGETVDLGTGDEQPLSFTALKNARAETVRRQIALFGEGPGVVSRLWLPTAPSPQGGRAAPTSVPGVRAVVESGVLVEVQPESNYVPALVHGRVEGLSHRAKRIAIEVNGRVAQVAPTYVRSSVRRFSAVVPEKAFKPGSNRIRALVIGG